MRLFIFVTFMGVTLNCFASSSILLRWNIQNVSKENYRAAINSDITNALGKLHLDKWVNNSEELDNVIQKLKKYHINKAFLHYRVDFKKIDHQRALRVRFVGIPVKFDSKPKNNAEKMMRDGVKYLVNSIAAQGDIDVTGDSRKLTFYRTPNERNVLQMFFYLPGKSVHVGESWRIPVQLLTIAADSVIQKSRSYNQVKLVNVHQSQQGRVAEIHYLIINKVSGYFERTHNGKEERAPFSVSYSVFGYGQFLIDKGCWLRQEMVYDYLQSGSRNIHKQSLFAMSLDQKS